MADLKKTLGYPTIIALSVTSLIGTGIFFGARLAAEKSGIYSIFAWVIMSLVSIYMAFVFGELVSMYPTAGGIYEYAKKAYGRFPSFMIGWTAWLVANIGTSVLIIAAIDYLIPDQSNWVKLAACVFVILVMNYITLRGVEISSKVVILFAVITVLLLLSIIVPGFIHFDISHFSTLFSPGVITNFPLILMTVFFIAETFFGWESVTYMAEETIDAEKKIPKGLIIVSIITCVLILLLVLSIFGILPIADLLNTDLPVSFLANQFYGTNASLLVAIGIFLVFVGSAAGAVITSPRLLLALARDKLFIEQLAEIHPKFRTPYKAIIFQTIVSILVVFIVLGKYDSLLSLLVPIALLLYVAVLVSLFILRIKKPDHPRSFKAPFGKTLSIVISLFFLVVMAFWLIHTPNAVSLLRIALSFILFGIPIYLLLTFFYNPEAVIQVTNFFSYFNLFLEDFFLPKSIRRQMLALFRDMEKKRILEFGSGVGSLTMHLAEAVGREGMIFATELSKKNAEILESRIQRNGHIQVKVIHDEHQVSRVHPSVKNVDMVFSVGMMGYMQNPEQILREMHNILPEHGKICFLEYIDFFKFLPNPRWLNSNAEIEQMFRNNGFSVRVIRVRSLFWNYLLVYGIKSKHNVPII
jgi:basic amino acid/polyamine antiporter, APA family